MKETFFSVTVSVLQLDSVASQHHSANVPSLVYDIYNLVFRYLVFTMFSHLFI